MKRKKKEINKEKFNLLQVLGYKLLLKFKVLPIPYLQFEHQHQTQY